MLTKDDPLLHDQRRARRPAGAALPLRRVREGRLLVGVAAGIARFVGTRPWTVRALFLLSLPLSWGVTAVGYLLLWRLLPLEEAAGEE